jgi:drug/metabolite transporter (DMT)-like permease
MVAAAALSNILGCVVSLPIAQGIAAVTAHDVFVFAMFGFCQVALGLSLYMLGSRLLPSSQAALIATLETPLMPFWIWLAFQEMPSSRTVLGGALVMSAVIADIIGDQREQKQPA